MTSVRDNKDLMSIVVELIKEEAGVDGVAPESRLDDLGMDSLTFSEVLMNIEKDYGVNLDRLQREFSADGEATVERLVDAISVEIS
jgi:acyl carrier protein